MYAEHSWNTVHNTWDETASADFLFQLGHAAAKYPPMTGYNQCDDPAYWPYWGYEGADERRGACLCMGNNGEALGANGY
jgi:hypothetical protein